MLKMLEIYHAGENTFKNWKLREILINPEHIVRCTPDDVMKEKLTTGILGGLTGLDPRAEFTRICQLGSMSVTVVGSVEQIESKLSENKRLLKG